MTEMVDILQKLENGAQFGSKGLEQYRDLSKETDRKDLESSRQAYYEQVEAAMLNHASFDEAMEMAAKAKGVYREHQAREGKKWVRENNKIIETGLETIENPITRRNLKTVYTDSTQTLSDGSNRFLADRINVILSVEATELKQKLLRDLETLSSVDANELKQKPYEDLERLFIDTTELNQQPYQDLETLFNKTKDMMERVGDVKVVGKEIEGKTVGFLKEKGIKLSRRYDPSDIVREVSAIGFIANKIIDILPKSEVFEGKPLSEASVQTEVKVKKAPTPSSTLEASPSIAQSPLSSPVAL